MMNGLERNRGAKQPGIKSWYHDKGLLHIWCETGQGCKGATNKRAIELPDVPLVCDDAINK